jgi:hypothetical protein
MEGLMLRLKANVQYNDWEGTVAADDADQRSFFTLLKEKNAMKEDEYPVSINLYIAENHAGKVEQPSISVLLMKSKNADDAKAQIGNGGKLKLRRVDIEISLNEYVGLFKRFDIVLTRNKFGLENREYEIDS